MIEFSIVNTVNTRNPRADFEAHMHTVTRPVALID